MEIDRTKAQEIVDALKEVSEDLSKRFGIQFSVGRCTYDKAEVNLKLTGKVQDGAGQVVTSTYKHHLANDFARAHGITFEGDTFIGTVWDINKRGACRVTGYNSRGKKFPIQCIAADGTHIKCSHRSFVKQILEPTDIMFMDWFTVDIEEDNHSPRQEENYLATDAYMTARFGDSPIWDSFMDACAEAFDTGNAERLWGYVYKMLFTSKSSLNEVRDYINFSLNK